jgi:plastocyanin
MTSTSTKTVPASTTTTTVTQTLPASTTTITATSTQTVPASTTTTTTTTTTSTSTTPSTTSSTSTTTSTTTTSTTQTQTPPPGTHVTILNGAGANPSSPGYSPATITVVIGVNNTVTWINNDVAIHTVTATDSSFNSGDIAPSAFWSHTFTTVGTYNYMCIYHSWMKGTVIVKS